MADLSNRDRITFHDTMEMLEVDFSNKTFSNAADADAFYDEADRQLAATGRLAGTVRAVSDSPDRPLGGLATAVKPRCWR